MFGALATTVAVPFFCLHVMTILFAHVEYAPLYMHSALLLSFIWVFYVCIMLFPSHVMLDKSLSIAHAEIRSLKDDLIRMHIHSCEHAHFREVFWNHIEGENELIPIKVGHTLVSSSSWHGRTAHMAHRAHHNPLRRRVSSENSEVSSLSDIRDSI